MSRVAPVAYTTLGFLTAEELSNEASGRAFFRALADTTPFLLPERYDDKEPIRLAFDMEHLEGPLGVWTSFQSGCFLWRRARPSVVGSYWMGHKRHPVSSIYISIKGRGYPAASLTEFLCRLANEYEPLLGYVNRKYAGDYHGQVCDANVAQLDEGVTLHALQHGLPTMPWAVVLGRDYIDLLGSQKVMSAPLFRAVDHKDYMYLQLTEKIELGEENYEEYDDIRRRAIAHLGADAFSSTVVCNPLIPTVLKTLLDR